MATQIQHPISTRSGATILIICLAATVGAKILEPTLNPSSAPPPGLSEPNSSKLIPTKFGSWVVDTTMTPVMPDPVVADRLQTYYSATLSRTYVNPLGHRIMLTLAYGEQQSRELQVHRPEVCYRSQGFAVTDLQKDTINTARLQIPVMRLVGTLGDRIEPITYWVRLGNQVVRGNIEQGIARLSQGLRGNIPDGMLVRVSSIGADRELAYKEQDAFIRELLAAIPDGSLHWLIPARRNN